VKKLLTGIVAFTIAVGCGAAKPEEQRFDAFEAPPFYTRAGVAKPNQLPKFFLGTWCGGFLTHNPEEQIAVLDGPRSKGKCQDNDEYEIIFTQKGVEIRDPKYGAVETICKYRSIKTWVDKTITATTKTTGVVVSRIVSRCEGEEGSWKVVLKIYISKGSLWVQWEG
jgi:hypothetical protein